MRVITAVHLSKGKQLSVQAGGGEGGQDQCPALKPVLHFCSSHRGQDGSIVPGISGNLSLFLHIHSEVLAGAQVGLSRCDQILKAHPIPHPAVRRDTSTIPGFSNFHPSWP